MSLPALILDQEPEEKQTPLLSQLRGTRSHFLAEMLTHFRAITLLLLLLLVENVVGPGRHHWSVWQLPTGFFFHGWVVQVQNKQKGYWRGRAAPPAKLWLLFSNAACLTCRLLHWKSINAIPRRGQWKAHIFFFCHQRTISKADSFKHYFIKLLAEEPKQKRQKIINMFYFPQSRTTYKGKTHASYFTLRPSEWLQQIITCMDDKKLCFLRNVRLRNENY